MVEGRRCTFCVLKRPETVISFTVWGDHEEDNEHSRNQLGLPLVRRDA